VNPIYRYAMKGMNLCAFSFTNLENLSILFFHFPIISSLPFNPMRNMMISPIAKAIPAVIPSSKGFRPPTANVVRSAMNDTEPPVENPPKNDTMNNSMYAFVTPTFFTSSSGLKKNSDVISAAKKAIKIANNITFFV